MPSGPGGRVATTVRLPLLTIDKMSADLCLYVCFLICGKQPDLSLNSSDL